MQAVLYVPHLELQVRHIILFSEDSDEDCDVILTELGDVIVLAFGVEGKVEILDQVSFQHNFGIISFQERHFAKNLQRVIRISPYFVQLIEMEASRKATQEVEQVEHLWMRLFKN